MKNGLIILFIFVCGLVRSQFGFNRAFHNRNEVSKILIGEIQGDLYHLSQNYSLYNYGANYLYRTTSSGQVTCYPIYFSWLEKGFPTVDTKILFVGRERGCDTPLDTIHNYLVKCDLSGIITATATLNSEILVCVQSADSTYLTFTDDGILSRYNSSLQKLTSITHTYGTVHSAVALANGDVVLSHSGGGFYYLSRLNSSGATVFTKSMPYVGLTKMMLYGNESIMGGIGTDLLRFTSSLSWLSTSSVPNFNDFTVVNDKVHCIGVHNYYNIDTGLTSSSQGSINTTAIEQMFIAPFGSSISVLSTGTANVPFNYVPQCFSSIGVYATNSANNLQSDLELMEMTVDSSYSEYYGGGAPPDLRRVYARFHVKLRNKGTTTVTSCAINNFFNPGVACGHVYFQEAISGFSLAPGDSVTVTMKTFVQRGSSIVNGQVSTNFCLYTSLPNGEADKVLADNESCLTVVISGLSEFKAEEQAMIYPNPSSGIFRLEALLPIERLELLNTLGHVLKTYTPDNSFAEIDLSSQTPGVYFVRIFTREVVTSRKLVKE